MEIKRGRPPKKAGESLTEKIEIRLTRDDYRRLKKSVGRGVSGWVRKLIVRALDRLAK